MKGYWPKSINSGANIKLYKTMIARLIRIAWISFRLNT